MEGDTLQITILLFIIVETIMIAITVFKIRNARKTVIVEAYRRMNYNLFTGFILLAMCPIWIYFFIDNLTDALYLLDGKHIKNIFQLFNLNYLKDLENYFIEKQMIHQAIDLIYYRSTFFKSITWIIILSGNAFIFLFRGLQKQRICADMLMTYSGNFKWDRVLEYSWSEERKEGKQKYYTLYIKVKREKIDAKLLNDEFQQIELKLDTIHRSEADKFLRETVVKT